MISPSPNLSSCSWLDKVTAHLKKVLSSVANLPLQDIDANAPIEVFGVRAILRMTVELEKSLGWLSKTLYFEYPTLSSFAQYLVKTYPEKLALLLGENQPEAGSDAICLQPPAIDVNNADLRRQDAGQKIAIVGLSCQFPHARNMHEFWDNLSQGRDCIEEIPSNRWDHRLYFDEEHNKLGKTYGRWGGFLERFDLFDASFFNISPREAEMMDPQERVFLECVYSAVEDAGYTPETLTRKRVETAEKLVGVYLGLMFEEYNLFRGDILGSPASIANRISYFCNFRGPSLTVDTMCSSSLTAIHLACQSLQTKECGAAIAGGVNLTLHPHKYLMLARLKMASPNGRCRAFGEGSNGYVPGEGVGAVVLKTLANALSDGDHIYGVIQGTAINQSGKARSYFAPSPGAQADVIEQALHKAGISSRIVTYVEAHGTGTSLGDPIEVAGLTNAFTKYTPEKQYCAIGSVKSNIGHCESAAGIAGLTKVLLQMKHRKLAPSLHAEQLNPNIHFEDTPFVVQRKLEEWKRPVVESDGNVREYPRIAGISSFGAGGSNAHILVEEYAVEVAPSSKSGPVLVVLSAKTDERLREQAKQLLEAIEQGWLTEPELRNAAYTLQVGREPMEQRLGMTARSLVELAEKLTKYLQGTEWIEELYRGEVRKGREMASVFRDDEDFSTTLDSWLKKGKWSKFLEMWTRGVDIDWTQLYSDVDQPRRVSLPTYPFAGERYWVEPFPEHGQDQTSTRNEKRDSARGALHRLVQTNSSRPGEQRYSLSFDGKEFFLAEHLVKGDRVLPAVAYLEMARAAIKQGFPERSESATLELRNTIWAEPIVVNKLKQVSITLLTRGDDRIEYQITSQDAGQDTIHCHGQAVWTHGPAPSMCDLERLKSQMDKGRIEPASIYAQFARKGLVHGPALQALSAIYQNNRETLAYLHLPGMVEATWGDYVLHPSLMDGALQATATMIHAVSPDSQQIQMPFALDSLRILSPCTREMVVCVRHSGDGPATDDFVKVDIDLCDLGGNVCLQMKGFSTRLLKDEHETAPGSKPEAELQAFVPIWNPVHPATCKRELVLPGAKVLLLGGDENELQWLRKSHANSHLLPLPAAATIDMIEAKLQECSFDHLCWIAPDVTSKASELHVDDDSMIQQQEAGVVALFRMIKALQHLGYDGKELRWTIITCKTQRVKKGEEVQATHAGVCGLIGSVVKEYPHWRVSLLDVDSLEMTDAGECLSMSAEERGNGLAYRSGEWFSQQFAHLPTIPESPDIRYKQHGVYVVIGGAGGLGEVWTRFMIENYQANVVWIGRQKLNAVLQAKIDSLKLLGPAPLYISADAANYDDLEQAYQTVRKTYPTIHGVIHSALVLQDQSIARMEESAFRASLAAKVDTSVNVDRVFGKLPLDFMLMFSSVMSFVKAAGQCNYAAGCTFQDSFAQSLQQRRAYPVKTMNWGYWGTVGIVSGDQYKQSMERNGIVSIEAVEGMAALRGLLNSDLSQMALIKTRNPQLVADIGFSEMLTYQPKVPGADLQQEHRVQDVPNSQTPVPEEALLNEDVEAVAAEILVATLISVGLFQNRAHRIADLSLQKHPAQFYELWLSSAVNYLQQRKLISYDLKALAQFRSLDDLWLKWNTKKITWEANCDVEGHLVLLEACLKALPQILRGQQLATDVIFPHSSMHLAEGIYRGNSVAEYFNTVLADTLLALIKDKLQANNGQGIRILEIGAGTGGTTTKLLPLLQGFPIEEYCYTDVSRAFLMHAEERFRPQFPWLTTAIFDVSRPVKSQALAGHYDFAIASNVLHATPDIRQTLRNAKAALRNEGVLLLNEISAWCFFTHLTFGLLEGWWLHQDTALRLPGSPGLTPEKWQEVLTEEGFESISFPAQEARKLGQQTIIARSDGWVRQPFDPPVVGVSKPQTPGLTRRTSPAIKPPVGGGEEVLREKSLSYFQEIVASTLKMLPHHIGPRRSFAEYGLDSILVGQLTYQLRRAFADVPGTLFFEVHTLDGLVDYFLKNKRQELIEVLSNASAAPDSSSVPAWEAERNAPQEVVQQEICSASTDLIVQESVPPKAQFEQILPPPSGAAGRTFDVAIIGLSGRYPKSSNLEEFWANLSQGVNCITEIPRSRWNWEDYYDSERGKLGKIYTKWGGFIDGIDEFDPLFFKLSPKEAKRMDPQERLFLQSCYHAIEDAGYTPEHLGQSEKIGVFVGVMNSRYTPQPAHASIANRVSYVFNFQGPSMAVDTACSSSLTAIHLALESIYSGLSECAIAGGVNLIIDPVHYMQMTEMTMLSSSHQCKSFGEQADGLVDAEGVGAVVLKPLELAQRDRDHIYAVIKGSAINAGGKTNGYTVPNPLAQSRLVKDALQRAGIDAEDVSYVEAHGTGTALGDPIEIAGLTHAFKEISGKKQFCSIGSLKSNIGHCESAAGIAGLTKLLLQMKYEQLVPSLHCDVPNPEINFSQTPFKLQKSLEKWQRPLRDVGGLSQELPRIAGVSSFGAGGANAHVIVQEYRLPVDLSRPGAVTGAKLVVLSARTAEQLKRKSEELLSFVRAQGNNLDLEAMAYTLQVGREAMEERLALLVSSREQLVQQLESYGRGEARIEAMYYGRVKESREGLSMFNESELRQIVEQRLEERELTKLAELWVKGVEVEWSRLYADRRPQRMSLPVYPFARERYWIETAEAAKVVPSSLTKMTVLHPLLHRNTSNLEEQSYSTTLTGDEFFLADHQVVFDGERREKVLPAAAYLEMARAAITQAWPAQKAGAELELRDTMWAEPVVVNGNSREIHLVLRFLENQAAKSEDEVEYEIYSEEENQECLHCEGRAAWASGAAHREPLDLEQMHGRMKHAQIEGVQLYAAREPMAVWRGPALRVVGGIKFGQGEVLAELQMASGTIEHEREYVLDPRLMDGALQAGLALLTKSAGEAGDEQRGTWLPYEIERVRVAGRCCGEMLAWARYTTGSQVQNNCQHNEVKMDIDLCDRNGNVCVQMLGLSWQQTALEVMDHVAGDAERVEAAASRTTTSIEKTSATLTRKEISFARSKTASSLVQPEILPIISLEAPSSIFVASAASSNTLVDAVMVPISLSQPGLQELPEAQDTRNGSAVKLFDRGKGIFSIEIDGASARRSDRDSDVMGDVLQALKRAEEEKPLKAVLLSGIEECFRGAGREDYNRAVRLGLYEALANFPSPLIAVLNKDADGGGLLAAAMCDFMVCNEAAEYGYTEVEKGFYPTPDECMVLNERFGAMLAQDFLFVRGKGTGRELRRRGWTCPMEAGEQVETCANELAESLADKSEEALRLLKQRLMGRLAQLVKKMREVEEESAPAIDHSRSAELEMRLSGDAIEVDRIENVLVIKVRDKGHRVPAKELLAGLSQIFMQAERSGCKAMVLSGDYTHCWEEDESAVLEVQRLMTESDIPVVAALAGDARGAGWLVSQICEAIVYNRSGVYTAAAIGSGVALRSLAASIFTTRLEHTAAQEILLSGGEYTGAELEQRMGAVAVDPEQVEEQAMRVAELWARLPKATLASWKKLVRESLRETMTDTPAGQGVEEQQKDESAGAPVGPITLASKVVSVTAHQNGVVVVRMEDRQARNMFSEEFMEGLQEAFAHIERTQSYKVVLLTGYDNYFASGGTKEALKAIQAGKMKFTDQKVFQAPFICKLPVVAAMRGHGIGAGWSLGMFADVVLFSREGRYMNPYMAYGFTPGAGATYLFPEGVGQDLARESLLAAKEYSGWELQKRGLKTRVLPREEMHGAAMAIAGQIAQLSRESLVELKRQLNWRMYEPLEESYRLELAMHEKTLVGQSEALEKIERFFKQQPGDQEKFEARSKAEDFISIEKTSGHEDMATEGNELAGVMESIKTLLASELQMAESDIDEHAQFIDLGLDSISGVSWVRKINEKYKTAIEATKVYSHPTLTQLGPYVKQEAERRGTLRGAAVKSLSAREKAEPAMMKANLDRKKLKSWRRSRSERFAAAAAPSRLWQPIAVIGMAGQFPQAKNLEQFWENIAHGKDCITQVPAERWDVNAHYHAGEIVAGKTISRWMGALENYDRFDPLFFNISPTEAESMDPQQRLFLQACWHGIEDAGYNPRSLSASRCGVFVGCGSSDYHLLSREQQLSAQGFTGDATSILAARISYFLNLQGPCISIDTACSSSLVALAYACDSLNIGSSDLALAGGVYVMAGPELHIKTSQAGMLSSDGKCYTFDQRANGFVPGEGVGVVLLKRLDEAQKDGDLIYGVIQGWGVNQDGKTNGITAPNPESQTRLEQEVYEKFHIDPASIQLIEAHGTGTKLGDPIEVEGLKKAFSKYTSKKRYCALGAVKSNIGHLATAAGIAGFIKLALALQHRQMPATINFERLNEHIELEDSPFYVNHHLQEWDLQGGERRQAAISSFGFSGTNAHVVIGEYDGAQKNQRGASSGDQKVMVLSARTVEQLKEKAEDLLSFIRRRENRLDLDAMAHTLQVGREAMEQRLALVVRSVEELGEKLGGYIAGKSKIKDFYQGHATAHKEVLGILSQDNEILETIVSKYVEQRNMLRLAELWVKGVEVEWSRLYAGRRPQRMRLPVYPFARERYWIEEGAGAGKVVPSSLTKMTALHPLLHRNTSDLEEQRYSTTLTGEEFFLADHQVVFSGEKREKVLPAAAYLEMARAAIEQASPSPESMILELKDTLWLQPLIVCGPKNISVAVLPDDEGDLGYEVYSEESEQRTVYCRGRAVHRHAFTVSKPDIERLTMRMTDKVDASTIYATFAKMGLNYGRAHQGIETIYTNRKQLIARLRLPENIELGFHEYVLHPGLMDSALQASIGLIVDFERQPDKPSLPFALDSLCVLSACTKELIAWIRYSEGSEPEDKIPKLDIDLCDPQGNVLVQMQGFSPRVLVRDVNANRSASNGLAAIASSAINEDAVFDSAFYRKLISGIVDHELSVNEAVELG